MEPKFWTNREETRDGLVRYVIYEDDIVWGDGKPRPLLAIDVIPPDWSPTTDEAGVSWPSTSDRRPRLATEVARAIAAASVEAERMNRDADEKDRQEREAREPAFRKGAER